jgi:hypothetical protein
MNKLIGIKNEDVLNSFILQKISKYFPDHIIIGDYISKKDINQILNIVKNKNIFYNMESFHNNYKYYRPKLILDNVISFDGSKSFFYPLLVDFIKSFKYDLISPSDNKNSCTCMIASNLKKINKYKNVIESYPECKIYGKFHSETLSFKSDNPYESFHRSAILTTSKHISALAIENSFQNGYFSEKIIIPLLSRTVPIFIGNKSIEGFINKKYFIYHDELIYLNNDQRTNMILKVYENLQLVNSINLLFTDTFIDYLNFLDNAFIDIDSFKASIFKSQEFKRKLLV